MMSLFTLTWDTPAPFRGRLILAPIAESSRLCRSCSRMSKNEKRTNERAGGKAGLPLCFMSYALGPPSLSTGLSHERPYEPRTKFVFWAGLLLLGAIGGCSRHSHLPQ